MSGSPGEYLIALSTKLTIAFRKHSLSAVINSCVVSYSNLILPVGSSISSYCIITLSSNCRTLNSSGCMSILAFLIVNNLSSIRLASVILNSPTFTSLLRRWASGSESSTRCKNAIGFLISCDMFLSCSDTRF